MSDPQPVQRPASTLPVWGLWVAGVSLVIGAARESWPLGGNLLLVAAAIGFFVAGAVVGVPLPRTGGLAPAGAAFAGGAFGNIAGSLLIRAAPDGGMLVAAAGGLALFLAGSALHSHQRKQEHPDG